MPIFWFGFLAAAFAPAIASKAVQENFMVIVMPCIVGLFAFLMFRKLLWDLADEVLDGGDFLIVRNRGVQERIPLSNIMNVNSSVMVSPPRVTLRLVQPGKFGNEIAFSPKRRFTLNPFAKSEVAEDLIVRVDRARRHRAA